jgi:uncharacterized membrane protein
MLLRTLPRYFLRGALLTVPLALTLYILYWIVRVFDDLLPIGIPGLGLIVTVSFVTAVGFLTSSVIGRTVFDWTERLLRRVPLVRLLYNSIKDLVGAFVGDKKSFNQPVTVQVSAESPVRALGFITRNQATALGLPDHVAVYFPQSYNFAGNLLLVPRAFVEPLDVSSSDVMTFIVSGGISGLGVGQSVLPPQPDEQR